ncbi:MAG: hypothetical protein CMQ54_01755 [Gammaproteobacteria bacterium]|nr:hypothetical protein [Gammaproteobacteria bacterium]
MLNLIFKLTIIRQNHNKILYLIDGAIQHLTYLRVIHSASIALKYLLLSSLTQVGHYEKNANQCDSRRRVAHGHGRWSTPL